MQVEILVCKRAEKQIWDEVGSWLDELFTDELFTDGLFTDGLFTDGLFTDGLFTAAAIG